MFPDITPLLIMLAAVLLGSAVGFYLWGAGALIVAALGGLLFIAAIIYIAANTRFT